jgi:hypothetical protein
MDLQAECPLRKGFQLGNSMPSNALLAPKQTGTCRAASMAHGGVSKAESVADDYLWRDTQDSSSAGQSKTIDMKPIDSH